MAKAIGYMQPTIDPNTRLYVPFNEGIGNIAKDYSQYCNHAQLTDVEWSPDGFNGAGKFNGTSSFGDCGGAASLDIPGFITIKALVKTLYGGFNEKRIASKSKWVPITTKGYILLQDQNKLGLIIHTDTGEYCALSDSVFMIGESVYGAGTYDKQHLKNYRNGIEKIGDALTTDIPSVDVSLTLGSGFDSNFFYGTIAFVLICALAESSAQSAADCYEVVCN